MKLTHDPTSLFFDGERRFLLSGEFHYFRVPADDWRRRMRLFKSAGGNMLASYVPWCVHEPEEGRIVFGDRPERDLAAFLRTAAEEGLPVLLRPGPYAYSELVCNGLPLWLERDHPALRWKRADGSDAGPFAGRVSYAHPLFLGKARRWYRAVAEVVRPFLASRGGPVAMVQLDNELAGVHLWFGPPDANPETFGLGREDGRWPRWLARKFGSAAAASEAYGGAWASLAQIPPLAQSEPAATPGDERRRRDFLRCYREQLRDYLATLRGWLREDGVDAPTCHNCGSASLMPLFAEFGDALGPDFLLGFDHYYSLGPAWGHENPTASYALGARFDVDTVAAMGFPPVGLEIPGGSPSDVPPILREDLLAAWMTQVAAGAKGLNLYVVTGGPEFGETGAGADIYDYNALVRSDGSRNDTFGALEDFGRFLAEHPDLPAARRESSVQVGFEWDALRLGAWAPPDGSGLSGPAAQEFAEKGFLFALAATPYPGAWTELRDGALDPRKPLLLAAPAAMSEAAQRAVVAFLEAGGRLLLAPWAPMLDQDLRPCTILRDSLRLPERRAAEPAPPGPLLAGGGRVWACDAPRLVVGEPPPGAEDAIAHARSGDVVGWRQKAGAGEAIVFGTTFRYRDFSQAAMLERFLERLGAMPVARSSNRNVLVEVHRAPDGRRLAFVSNLHASPQRTTLTLFDDAGAPSAALDLALPPMRVETLDLQPRPNP